MNDKVKLGEKPLSLMSLLTGLIVAILVIGLGMTAFTLLTSSKADAAEVVEAVPATKVILSDTESVVTIIDAGPAYSCEINVKGDSPWSLGVLLAAAKQIEGCKIFVDPTPLVFYKAQQ